MTLDIVSLIAQSSGMMGLAIFAIWVLNHVWEDRVRQEARHAETINALWLETKEALEQNTQVITKLLERMKASG